MSTKGEILKGALKLSQFLIDALTTPGKPSRAAKIAVTNAANKANMSVPEFKEAAKKQIKGVVAKGSESDEAVAKRLGISVAELKKKRKASLAASKKKPKVTHTKKEDREIKKLVAQREREERGDIQKGAGVYGGKRVETVRGVAGRKGLQRPHTIESPGGRLKSKQKISTKDFTKQEKFKQELDPHADPQRMIAGEMGFKKSDIPSEKQLEELGLTIKGRKSGGTVKRNKGGAVRGVGQANKGFGNATYSRKMY